MKNRHKTIETFVFISIFLVLNVLETMQLRTILAEQRREYFVNSFHITTNSVTKANSNSFDGAINSNIKNFTSPTPGDSIFTDKLSLINNNYSHQLQIIADNTNDSSKVNVKNFGAKGDGASDDSASIKAAITSGSKMILFPSGNYKVSSFIGISPDVDCIFEKGAILQPDNGVTITFMKSPTAGLYKIFSGTGLVNFGIGTTVYPEWWGAVGDGVTDDRLAFLNCLNSIGTIGGGNSIPDNSTKYLYNSKGTVELQAKIYRLSSFVSIDKSYVSIVGKGTGYTRLNFDGSYCDGIVITGSNSTQVRYPVIKSMTIAHTGTAITGTGITLINTSNAQVEDVQFSDFKTGVYMNTATNSSLYKDIVTVSSGKANAIGFHAENSNISSVWSHCTVDMSGCNGSTMGFWITGALVSDNTIEFPQISSCSYGIYMDASAVTPIGKSYYACNNQIINPVIDQFTAQAIFLRGFVENSSITINGGWLNPAPVYKETDAIYLDKCRGVTISNTQIMSDTNWAYSYGIKALNNSSNIIVTGCLFTAEVRSVYFLDVSSSIVNGNTFKSKNSYLNDAQRAYQIIYLQNSSKCTINNNILEGNADYGIYIDNNVTNTTVTSNIIDPSYITYPYTSLGKDILNDNNIK